MMHASPEAETPASGSYMDRLQGIAVGAAVGDALGMPLEFGPAIPERRLVRDMAPGRLPAGSFTDDTEMALALADSLLERFPLDPDNLAQHFVDWYRRSPPDVGNRTRAVLQRIDRGVDWRTANTELDRATNHGAGNGSLMRCWPVASGYHRDLDALVKASRLQSEVTHTDPECLAACAFVNLTIHYLLQGNPRHLAVSQAVQELSLPSALEQCILGAADTPRSRLDNSGWVRHTVQSAVWGLLTTSTFEEAVIQVVNLGNDADTAGAVVGALAGAAYGCSAIPVRWTRALRGEWPLHSGKIWDAPALAALAKRLAHLRR